MPRSRKPRAAQSRRGCDPYTIRHFLKPLTKESYEACNEISEPVALSKVIQAELEVQATSAGETAYLPPLARRSRGQGGVMGKAADGLATIPVLCWRTEYFHVPVMCD